MGKRNKMRENKFKVWDIKNEIFLDLRIYDLSIEEGEISYLNFNIDKFLHFYNEDTIEEQCIGYAPIGKEYDLLKLCEFASIGHIKLNKKCSMAPSSTRYGNFVSEEEIKEIFKYSYDLIVGSDVELIQYTGIKDKNGKEIFKDDIVKLIDIDDSESIGIIVHIESNASFEVKEINEDGIDYYSFSDLSRCEVKIEVIGNIFENPELLKGKND